MWKPEDGLLLCAYARGVIAESLGGQRASAPEGPAYDEPGATFVTLRARRSLRGCIGTLEPHRPLHVDVAKNARAAAFDDPRFRPVDWTELADLTVEVSILSPRTRVPVASETAAIAALRPGVDGVVLRHGRHRGTFLPQVWDEVPEPAHFLSELKRKAGLPRDFWAPGIELERYTVEKFVEHPVRDSARKAEIPT